MQRLPPCTCAHRQLTSARNFSLSTRSLKAKKGSGPVADRIRYNFNANPYDDAPLDPDSASYSFLTAKDLALYKTPPRRFKALTRDFIDDSLYNPHYGYFSQQAVIFDSNVGTKSVLNGQTGFDFANLSNSAAFDREVGARYGELEGELSLEALPGKGEGSARQVWHTPTELFKVSFDADFHAAAN